MRQAHMWSRLREVCLACGRSRQEVVEHEITQCDGTLKTREFLRNGVWTREVIDPTEGYR